MQDTGCGITIYDGIPRFYSHSENYNHKITQHFFFFTKRKPVLKEKQIIFSFLAQVLSLEKKESVVLIS